MAGQRFEVEPSFRAFLVDLGLAPDRVARRAELPRDLFARRSVELTVAEYYRLWEAMDTEAAGRDLLPDVSRAISVELFSPPIFAALCSPNLAIAAKRLADHKPLVGPVRVLLDHSDDELSVTFVWPLDPQAPHAQPPPLLAFAEMLFWVRLARIGTREPVRPVTVTSPQQPHDVAAAEDLFGARVHAGKRHGLAFSAVDAQRSFLSENESMWRIFAPELRRRLADIQVSDTVADRVRAALHETLPAGDPSMSAVTSILGTTSRTLQRQLSQEGTTFQRILTATRADLAEHYLTVQDLRTSDIAYLLGYEDTNSFFRAFRSWTGRTPEAVRAARTT